jgi:hypothetical protein
MEIKMKRAAFVIFASFALAAPVAAQSLSILLPVLSFPEDPVTSSSKGCEAKTTAPTCQLQE